MVFFKQSIHKYMPVGDEGKQNDPESAPDGVHNMTKPRLREWSELAKIFSLFLVVAIAFSGLGFWFGTQYRHDNTNAIIPLKTIQKSFVYNRTFAEAPSEDTDRAWEGIFPPHGGFFHSAIAPQGASLAVYHQLHCLDGMRHAYWTLHDAYVGGKNISLDSLPDYSTPWHTRHCIDFLRQMLMCNADLTIEYNIPEIHGIRGFGVKHECKRWDQIVNWTISQQAEGQKSTS